MVSGRLSERIMMVTYFNRQFHFTIILIYLIISLKLTVFVMCLNFITNIFQWLFQYKMLYRYTILCGIVDFIVNIPVQPNCKVAI